MIRKVTPKITYNVVGADIQGMEGEMDLVLLEMMMYTICVISEL